MLLPKLKNLKDFLEGKKTTLEKDVLVFVLLTDFAKSKQRGHIGVYVLLHEKTANNNFKKLLQRNLLRKELLRVEWQTLICYASPISTLANIHASV